MSTATTAAHHAPGVEYSEDDQALAAALLDGADPEAWVVARLDDLVWQVQAAIGDELRQHGKVSPGRAAFKVSRLLQELGLVVDTKHRRP